MVSTTLRPKQDWQSAFLLLLPALEKNLRWLFRDLDPLARDEAVQDCTAAAMIAFRRHWQNNRMDAIFATPLARYAAQNYRSGRRSSTPMNSGDLLSEYCRQRNDLQIESLNDHGEKDSEQWRDLLVEDKRSGPGSIAAIRIDFEDWLETLPRHTRRIAKQLATGETTSEVAKQEGLSRGRISQLRRELRDRWYEFQTKPEPVEV